MTPELEALYLKSVAATSEKQAHLSQLIGQRPWRVDLAVGKIWFGDDLAWQIQLLGTESHTSRTWLWAWANQQSNFPPPIVTASVGVQAHGRQTGIAELTRDMLPLAELDGHTAAVVGSSLIRANAYYRGPYQNGAAFFLIIDPSFPPLESDPVFRLTTVFPRTISTYDVSNHRVAFEAYVDTLGLSRAADGPRVVVQRNGAAAVTATFDQQQRLTNLTSHLSGA